MKDTDLAYLAALFDSEGCLHYSYKKHCAKRGITSECWLAVTSTDQSTIDSLKASFGGYVYSYRPYLRRKVTYVWRASGKRLFSVLEAVIPYMRMKRDHAKMLLDHQVVISKPGKKSEEEKQILRTLAQRSKDFNHRGPRPNSTAKADYDYSLDQATGEPRLQTYNGKDPELFLVENTPNGGE